MRSLNGMLCSLTLLLVASGCATDSAVRRRSPPLACPQPQPVPSDVMQPREPSFLARIRNFLYESEPRPTK